MTIERQYQATLIYLEQEVDGFLGAAFIDLDTGQSLVAHSVRPGFDPSLVSAAGHAAILAQQKLMASLGDESVLEDVLVTSSLHVYIYQPISPLVFLYVAADLDETNPALVRSAVKRYSKQHLANDNEVPVPRALSATS